ncbi:SDR family oxidoreductase [Candidatus Sumerlaeota bacterium]|nr:SDR family oxidoreductase [Candidatus Sumerlaeota bacterium]
MASYLVTGGAGFIGSNIVRELLDRGESVRVIDDFSTGRRENLADVQERIDLIEGSICDPDAMKRAAADMDYVLHQAALPSVPRSVKDPVESLNVGTIGTTQVLLAARDAGVKRVVYAASSSAYGDQEDEWKSEALLPTPLSPYAAAKLSGEHLCSVFTTCYGLETISLRYFNVFGPRQDPKSLYSAVIPIFITAVLEGRSPTVDGDGLQTRDFTYVSNNVEANILAATCGKGSGQVFNIACGTSYSILDLLDAINQALGAQVPPAFGPARVGDVRHSLADVSMAREVLGYEARVSFEDGIRKTVEWYRSAQSL